MAQSVEHILGKDEVVSSILTSSSKKSVFCFAKDAFFERCVPQAERDARFARDVWLRQVMCASRQAVPAAARRGTHLITLRRSRKSSLVP